MIFAVDFDGTLSLGKYPSIGAPNIPLLQFLRARKAMGDRIILFTCRTGKELYQAVKFAAANGLCFDAVNENVPEIIARFHSNPRKIYADCYIDDRAMNPFTGQLVIQENRESERSLGNDHL